ncbi:MAG: cytochrome P450 [Porticoccaceae bacterium]|jgi:cytochrome P450|nr:cytochrome P450 [Porticoccaceae bacterium]MEA3299424.1 cytochrome P450 [Pseudomonadota bacterium]HLS99397.1 cytochrome P450 [Porticoccaceae bacterium]
MNSTETATIPAHVPADRVVDDFPLVFGKFSEQDPWETMLPGVCQGPDAIYATNLFPGRGPAWVFRRQSDQRAIFMDTKRFSNKAFSALSHIIGESWDLVPAELDPPEHTQMRGFLNREFSPPAMAKLEDKARAAARRSLAGLRERGQCELMADYAFPFPVSVVLDMLDLPQERIDEFLEWEHMIMNMGDMAGVKTAIRAVTDYLRGLIEERKQNPGNDLVSQAIAATIDGEKLSDDRLIGYFFNLYIGGLDTVSASIGNHVRHLANHPEHQQYLRDHPERIGDAVNELMRLYAPATIYRTCVEKTELGGVTIMPGDKVAMITALPCRDEDAYPDPHRYSIDRGSHHLAFGNGAHACLGIHLAKRELRIALEELLAALPPFRIAPGARITNLVGGVIQPTTLPLVWDS